MSILLALVALISTPAIHPGMKWITYGSFLMGSTNPMFPDAKPVHRVRLSGFYIDRTLVTNAQFARFVQATRYVTVAERKPDPKLFPGVPLAKLVPGAAVFTPPTHPVDLRDPIQWWSYVPGANWRHPEGPHTSLNGKGANPVVDVAWEDAMAYANWAGKTLPTEAQWEYAARGGLSQEPYVWGKTFRPHGKFMANTFQGAFPYHNTAEDGFATTSPVASFPANGYGLFDMAGNVWEWCLDWYRTDYYRDSLELNPKGPTSSYDADDPGEPKRVQRGGSFLCTDEYCSRYMPGSRGKGEPSTGSSNVGFRCVVNVKGSNK